MSASQASGSNANIVEGSDYVGVGYVGHASDNDDLQASLAPTGVYGSQSRFSSSNAAYEEEDLQQRVMPADLNDIRSSALRSAASNREDVQTNIGYHDLAVNNEGNYESYSRQRQQEESETSRTVTKPQIYYIPAPITTSTSQRASEASNQQRVSMAVRPGTTTILRVPVNVIHTAGVPDRTQQYNSRSSTGSAYQASGTETRPTYTVYYAPSNTYSDRYASTAGNQQESSRVNYQPEKYRTPDLSNYNSFNTQSRSQNDDLQESETYQTRLSPTIVDSASRYSSGNSANNQHSRVIQPYPIQSIDSSSIASQRTAEEQQQRRYSPARPNYVHRTLSNNEESQSESSRTESTNLYTPVVSSQSRQSQQQQSQMASRVGGTFSPYVPPYGSSQRLGSGVTYSNSDNLLDYMSESERLARLQHQQVANSRQSSSSTSSQQASVLEANRRTLEAAQRLDSAAANFVSSSNLASRNSDMDAESLSGTGAGGYQRVKQWQKQSQWESGEFQKI